MKPAYYQVKPGRYIHWPEYIPAPVRDGGPQPGVPRRESLWAGPGDVIKIDHPVLQRALAGQEFKCQHLNGPGKGRLLDADSYPITIKRMIERHDGGPKPAPPAPRAEVRGRDQVEPDVQSSLPGIDEPEEPVTQEEETDGGA
jgi:hypothetical protein